MQFHCPICDNPLEAAGSSLRCTSGHSYDLAREGYCNLLLVQQKASLAPGDNPEMVAARRRFLESGYYQPIAMKMVEILGALGTARVLDAGCGEGYYLNFLRSAFPAMELTGTDISKAAIKAAAKKYKDIAWAVASNRHLPFAKESVSTILSLFGFPIWESFKKIQPENGYVLLLDPASEHLWSLREIIYPEVKLSALVSAQPAFDAGYSLVHEEKLDFSFLLPNSSSIQDLLAMTPHGYRVNLPRFSGHVSQ